MCNMGAGGKARQQNRTFMRLLALPARCLTRARDCYVKGMNSFVVNPPKTTIRRSYSSVGACSSNADDGKDFQELLRAASGRKESNVVVVQPQMRLRKTARSCSVAMGRIDEEKPCFFEEEDNNIRVYVINNPPLHYYPRSKSHVVTKRTLGL